MTPNDVPATDRFPFIVRDSLTPEAQAIWDKRTRAVNSTGLGGHFNVLMHAPELCSRVSELEGYFRFDSTITKPERELITITVLRAAQARYAWARHEAQAVREGVPREVVEAVRIEAPLASFPPKERLLVELARALVGMREPLPQHLSERVMAEKGLRWTVEAIGLVGHYSMVATLVHGFGVKARPIDGDTF